jgi:hypothetical protein
MLKLTVETIENVYCFDRNNKKDNLRTCHNILYGIEEIPKDTSEEREKAMAKMAIKYFQFKLK